LKRLLVLGLVAAAALAVAGPAVAQCAMCKTALTNSSEGQRVANNFNHAILVMFFAPYFVLGVFVALVFRGKIRSWLTRHAPVLARPVTLFPARARP
jgi:hypothetical protein